MGLIRIIVVFLLGIGAAFGAYTTGAMNYLSGGSAPGWFRGSHPVVLRMSDDGAASHSACQPRYSVDNHSSRRVLVLFTPANEQFADEAAPRYDDSTGTPPGYYGSGETNAPFDGQPGATGTGLHAQTVVPVEVRPGEEKYVGRQMIPSGQNGDSAIGQYGASVRAGLAALRCGNSRLVTLQLNDCTTDESGVCSTTSTSNSGGDYNGHQGDE